MTERIERAGKFTRDTLVPVSLVIAICGLIWFAASDRTKAWGLIEQHSESIRALQEDQKEILSAVHRIDRKIDALATKP